MRQRILAIGIVLSAFAFFFGLTTERVYAQSNICQTYHVSLEVGTNVNVRSCPNADCPVIGNLPITDPVCVRGISAENTDWLVVNADPQNPNSQDGFALANLLEVGEPGTQDPNTYCNAYSPNSGSVIVRSEPAHNARAIGQVNEGEVVCIINYGGSFIYWLGVQGSGWVSWRDMEVVRTEVDCNAWDAVRDGVNVHESPSFRSAVVRTLALGERVCIDRETDEDLEWIGFRQPNGITIGWIYAPLMYAVEEPTLAETPEVVVLPDPAQVSLPPFAEAVANINVRQTNSLDAPIVSVVRRGTQLDVLGMSADGWYWVRNRVTSGWVSGASITLYGDTSQIPQVAPPALEVKSSATTDEPKPLVKAPTLQRETVAFQIQATQDPFLTDDVCEFHNVVVASAVVRDAPISGAQVATRQVGDTVCVLADSPQQPTDWAFVRFRDNSDNLVEGFMARNLIESLEPAQAQTGTPQFTPAFSDPAVLPIPTATPIGVVNSGIISAAATLTPTPAACLPGQTDNCYTPTPANLSVLNRPTPVIDTTLLAQEIPLTLLRLRDATLRSPFSSTTYRFTLPQDWQMGGTSILSLDLIYTESPYARGDAASGADVALLNSTLNVTLNDRVISTVTLNADNAGETPIRLQIPLAADELNRLSAHRLGLVLQAREHCELTLNANVQTVIDSSFIRYEYFEQKPLLDLANYPRPFYNQRPPTERENVVLVLPAEPTINDLNAAATISAGLGLLTDDTLLVRVRRADTLSDFERDNSDLILVGSPENHTLIADYYQRDVLPTRYVNGEIRFEETVLNETDGIVQLTYNVASDDYAVMVVTSLTEEGLRKGAQLLAGPPSLLGLGGALAVVDSVSDIQRLDRAESERLETLTLTDIGALENPLLRGFGSTRYDLTFSIPAGTELTDGAFVELLFNYSYVPIAPDASFSVLINEQPISSFLLSDRPENANNSAVATDPNEQVPAFYRLRAPIPPSMVLEGRPNSLTFIMNTDIPSFNCNTPDNDLLWFLISSNSRLHLPRQPISNDGSANYLNTFPASFIRSRNLNDLWINLPDEPTDDELEQTMRIMSAIGQDVGNGEGLRPTLNLGALPPDTDLSRYNFIVIGRPTNNSFLAELNSIEIPTGDAFSNQTRRLLPQPFVEGTDEIEQVLDDVSYRVLVGYEFGILQMFDSPWFEGRKVLVVSGTGELGQRDAANILVDSAAAPSDLQGDVVFVAGTFVTFTDSSRVFNSLAILDEVVGLATERADIDNRATQTAVATANMSIAAVTPTPLPGTTPTPFAFAGEGSATPIVTAMPSLVPTATTTPLPLDSPELNPPVPVRPVYVDYLIFATLGVMVITLITLAVRQLFMRNRRGR